MDEPVGPFFKRNYDMGERENVLRRRMRRNRRHRKTALLIAALTQKDLSGFDLPKKVKPVLNVPYQIRLPLGQTNYQERQTEMSNKRDNSPEPHTQTVTDVNKIHSFTKRIRQVQAVDSAKDEALLHIQHRLDPEHRLHQEQYEREIKNERPGDPIKHRLWYLGLNADIENAMRRKNIPSNAYAEDLLADPSLPKEWHDELTRCLTRSDFLKASMDRLRGVLVSKYGTR